MYREQWVVDILGERSVLAVALDVHSTTCGSMERSPEDQANDVRALREVIKTWDNHGTCNFDDIVFETIEEAIREHDLALGAEHVRLSEELRKFAVEIAGGGGNAKEFSYTCRSQSRELPPKPGDVYVQREPTGLRVVVFALAPEHGMIDPDRLEAAGNLVIGEEPVMPDPVTRFGLMVVHAPGAISQVDSFIGQIIKNNSPATGQVIQPGVIRFTFGTAEVRSDVKSRIDCIPETECVEFFKADD